MDGYDGVQATSSIVEEGNLFTAIVLQLVKYHHYNTLPLGSQRFRKLDPFALSSGIHIPLPDVSIGYGWVCVNEKGWQCFPLTHKSISSYTCLPEKDLTACGGSFLDRINKIFLYPLDKLGA